jgi:hypothetical protein
MNGTRKLTKPIERIDKKIKKKKNKNKKKKKKRKRKKGND